MVFAVIDSSIEGANVAFFVNFLVGLALMCYRLWPSSAKERVALLSSAVILLLAVLLLSGFQPQIFLNLITPTVKTSLAK